VPGGLGDVPEFFRQCTATCLPSSANSHGPTCAGRWRSAICKPPALSCRGRLAWRRQTCSSHLAWLASHTSTQPWERADLGFPGAVSAVTVHVMDEITRDVTSDVTWMTYAELGRARAIDAASAKRLAIRRRWRRQAGNDGAARVAVPVTEAAPRTPKPGDDPGDIPGERPGDITGVIGALDRAVVTLREQLLRTENRANQAEILAEQARDRSDRADQRAVLADLRADRAEKRVEAADSHAQAAVHRADAAYEDRRAAEDRAQRAEDRAAELRDKIEAFQVQLVTAEAEGNALTIETAELTTQLSQARRVAQEAQESAEELRRVEQARAGKGRLARLRAAWRGQL
jgi:hypothetical protein